MVLQGGYRRRADPGSEDVGATWTRSVSTPAVTVVHLDQQTMEAIVAEVTAQLRRSGELGEIRLPCIWPTYEPPGGADEPIKWR